LVAVVTAGNMVVTHGAIKPHQGRNVIRLASYCVFVPKGAVSASHSGRIRRSTSPIRRSQGRRPVRSHSVPRV
jgi:hypothetical protein